MAILQNTAASCLPTTSCSMEVARFACSLFCGHAVTPLRQNYKSKCQDYPAVFKQFVKMSSKWHATILVLYNINYRKPITILKYIQTENLYGT